MENIVINRPGFLTAFSVFPADAAAAVLSGTVEIPDDNESEWDMVNLPASEIVGRQEYKSSGYIKKRALRHFLWLVYTENTFFSSPGWTGMRRCVTADGKE
ncbi:MAG: hypothetical protein SOH80_05530 [Eubacteriales bacterium]